MKKSELIERLANRTGQKSAEVKKTIDALNQELIEQVVAGGKVILPGFGTFSRSWTPPRQGRNPRTGRLVQLHPRYHARFSPGATLQNRLKALIPTFDQDPEHQKARRTARTLVTDLKLYHGAMLEQTRKTGKPDDAFQALIESAMQRYQDRVPESVRKVRNYLEEELAAVLRFRLDLSAFVPQEGDVGAEGALAKRLSHDAK